MKQRVSFIIFCEDIHACIKNISGNNVKIHATANLRGGYIRTMHVLQQRDIFWHVDWKFNLQEANIAGLNLLCLFFF